MKKVSHRRKNRIWFHLYEVPRTGKCRETESRTEVPRAWGRKDGELLLNAYRVSGVIKILKSVWWWLHNMWLISLNCTLKMANWHYKYVSYCNKKIEENAFMSVISCYDSLSDGTTEFLKLSYSFMLTRILAIILEDGLELNLNTRLCSSSARLCALLLSFLPHFTMWWL